jgi:predicted phage terminase large subunit-like protein
MLSSRHDYDDFLLDIGKSEEPVKILRELCQTDLYFLFCYGLNRSDAEHDWLFDRCVEVQNEPDSMLDLWAREHYKSSLITFALTIQEILKNPEITIGIFSHTRPIAKAFLRQIKREFELNQQLQGWFPDILYRNPGKEALKWSEDDGIIVKRQGNPKESTVEAWGVVDGQPTGKHFSLLVYDDIVTKESVTTPEMIEKTTEALALSYNLGAQGGKRRFIGTRYHFSDTYKIIMERGTATPRIHPATYDGTAFGMPVFLSQELLDEKRRDFGSFVFSCFVADTKILMGDWIQKNISKIRPGDTVVGYQFGSQGKGYKTNLVESKVVAINTRLSKIVRFTFESGRTITCTKDHKFYTGRQGIEDGGTENRRTYNQLGFGVKELGAAISIYDPRHINGKHNKTSAAWLAGLFDGEGSMSNNVLAIHQSKEHNPEVCARLEQVLDELKFDYGQCNRSSGVRNGCNHKGSIMYYLRGGRSEKLRFLTICKPVRGYKIVYDLFKYGSKDIGLSARDKLVGIEELGEAKVYSIQTETGNYIADGYAVKNCQMLQNPVADSSQGFSREWLRFFDGLAPPHCNWYLVVDAANGKRKHNDYTSIWAVGLGPDKNYYCIPEVRDRINLTERSKRLIDLHRKYQPIQVRYEQYGMQSDIAYIKLIQEKENYRFDIIEVSGPTSKVDRIKRLVPLFENGVIYLPRKHIVTDYEGKTRDLIHDFIESELIPFPVPLHDDALDALARVTDDEGKYAGTDKKIALVLQWPKPMMQERTKRERPNWRL